MSKLFSLDLTHSLIFSLKNQLQFSVARCLCSPSEVYRNLKLFFIEKLEKNHKFHTTKNYKFDPAALDKVRVPETYEPLDAAHWEGVYIKLIKQYPKIKVNLI